MQRSITTRLIARPAASFTRPAGRDRERRLGLRRGLAFQPAAAHVTVLRGSDRASVRLDAGGRTMLPAPSRRPPSGPPRPTVIMHWARSGGSTPGRRSSAAPAPWRG